MYRDNSGLEEGPTCPELKRGKQVSIRIGIPLKLVDVFLTCLEIFGEI